MQLYCDRELLATALKTVLPAVPSRPLIVTDSGILLSANGHLEVSATDREVAIQYRMRSTKPAKPGSVVLPARTITDLVALLDTERVDMALDEETNVLALQCGRTQAHVRGWKAKEFPVLPVTADEPVARMEARVLRDAVGRVLYAASTDASRPTLCGVLMQFAEEQVTLVAADGFRLATYTVPLATSMSEPLNLVVSANGMRELQKSALEGEVSIGLDQDRQHVIFETGDVTLTSHLGGKFPDYHGIIPQDQGGIRAVVDRSALRRACRTAHALRNEAGILRIEFSPERVVVSDTSVEAGEGRTELEAAVEGTGEVALNIKYLTDAVTAVGIAIEAGAGEDKHRPVLVRPVGMESQIAVIMPMHVG